MSIDWILTIHDAFIVSPVQATDVRQRYAVELEAIHANRANILNDYFKSINLHPKAMKDWNSLMDSIVPTSSEFKVSEMALK